MRTRLSLRSLVHHAGGAHVALAVRQARLRNSTLRPKPIGACFTRSIQGAGGRELPSRGRSSMAPNVVLAVMVELKLRDRHRYRWWAREGRPERALYIHMRVERGLMAAAGREACVLDSMAKAQAGRQQ